MLKQRLTEEERKQENQSINQSTYISEKNWNVQNILKESCIHYARFVNMYTYLDIAKLQLQELLYKMSLISKIISLISKNKKTRFFDV